MSLWVKVPFDSFRIVNPRRGLLVFQPAPALGPSSLRREKRYRDMSALDNRTPSDNTVAVLETLERHAYIQIAELIDNRHLDEADKIADILKKVGIV
uniref:Uncharacterized protein n=1 Tax=uncultured prokaryote TaxID=198431 RepID=A0A0H5Q8N7_9ZZZZ|nr:hypothetical protein [uncultured prokaryote]